MASARIVIPKRVYKDGTVAFILHIYIGADKFRKTICSVPEQYVNRKKGEVKSNYKDAIKLNNQISKALADTMAYINECEEMGVPVDPVQFFQHGRVDDDVVSHVRAKYDKLLEDGKVRTAAKYKVIADRIEEFGMNRAMKQVDQKWIEQFEKKLAKLGNGKNTRSRALTCLGSVFKDALRNGRIRHNPFDGYAKPTELGNAEKLNEEEFRKLQEANLTGVHNLVRNIFIFATLARGMRAHDILTLSWKNIQGDRLRYTAQKTGKYFDLKVLPAMQAILDELDKNSVYIFAFVKLPPSEAKKNKAGYDKHVNSCNSYVNKILSQIMSEVGINKHITMHCARHTFAAIGHMAHLPTNVIQQLLGHSKMETTIRYMKQVMKSDELDQAVDELF